MSTMPLSPDWYPAINVRRSRRNYDKGRPMEPELVERLSRVCSEFRPYPAARLEFVPRPSQDIFDRAFLVYGNIRNVSAFLAFIGDASDPNMQEKLGYTGEGIILEATSRGLGTCWAALSYKSSAAQSMIKLNAGEKLVAVSPVGYTVETWTFEEKALTAFGATHQRKPLSGMVTGLEKDRWPQWAAAAVEAARLAPSATNRQPWSFHIEQNSITVSVRGSEPEFNVSKRLDCGIAMLHVELGALSQGARGRWEFLRHPGVARFVVDNQ